MYTHIKEVAVKIINGNFYSERIIKKFLNTPNHKNDRKWIKTLTRISTLKLYIDCHDVRFFGHEEKVKKNTHKYYAACGITPNQMSKFVALNQVMLLDIYENSTNEELKSYYHLLVYLIGHDNQSTYIVNERRKLQEIFHKKQAHLIKKFVSSPPTQEELRDFIIISILFSQPEKQHSEETRQQFLTLCNMLH